MAYALASDVAIRLNKTFSASETTLCTALLDDAAIIIDAFNFNADSNAKKLVSCRMVIRAIGNSDVDIPIGATQGTMSALGYAQSWTVGNGSTGELYLSKLDKQLLAVGNKIGSYSPIEELVHHD